MPITTPVAKTVAEIVTEGLQIYPVGGAVRDRILGLEVHDVDWVVVGATPEEMTRRGFLPIGRDFPVFLHPKTRQEFALARTERKSGQGYRGFHVYSSPEVTLEEDLARRDLTINAMAAARFGNTEEIIDPYGGQADLKAKVLRHVTPAFREDPVRILRLARFAARFHDFKIALETKALLREMVLEGETQHLVPERVWQEVCRGLMEQNPARMLQVLVECGAAQVASADDLERVNAALTKAVALKAPLNVRYVCLHLVQIDSLSVVPSDCAQLQRLYLQEDEQGSWRDAQTMNAPNLLALLQRCDALRRPERFLELILALECFYPDNSSANSNVDFLRKALAAVQSVDNRAIVSKAQAEGLKGDQIGAALDAARCETLQGITK